MLSDIVVPKSAVVLLGYAVSGAAMLSISSCGRAPNATINVAEWQADSQAIVSKARMVLNDSRSYLMEMNNSTDTVVLFRLLPRNYAVVQFAVPSGSRAGSIVRLTFNRETEDTVAEVLDRLPTIACAPEVAGLADLDSIGAYVALAAIAEYRKGPTEHDEYRCAKVRVRSILERSNGDHEVRLEQFDRTVRSGGAIVTVSSNGIPRVDSWFNW